MSRRSERIATRIASRDRHRERGTVTIRHVTLLQSGPDTAPNPPRVTGLVVNGTPTYTHNNPGLVYNQVWNPWGDGGVIGGALPEGFLGFMTGITATQKLIGRGTTSDGLPYTDIEVSGVPSTTSGIQIFAHDFVIPHNFPAVQGDAVSGWLGFEILESEGVANAFTMRIAQFNGSALVGTTTFATGVPAGVETRTPMTMTVSAATATQVAVGLFSGVTTIGLFARLRVRFIFPVLNRGAVPLTDTVPLATLAARRGGVPVYGAVGPSTLGVRGTPLAGRFIAGDELYVQGLVLRVAGDGIASANAASLSLAAPLAGVVIDGDPIVPKWRNEAVVPAQVQGLGRRLPDGDTIEARDLFVTIAAAAVPFAPIYGDFVTLPDGDTRQVIVATPLMHHGMPVRYRMQIR